MVDAGDRDEPDARTLTDISALADGTLDPERASAIRDLIGRSPELSRRYADERRAVEAVRALRADRAPARLRLAVGTPRRSARRVRSRPIYAGALGAAVAAAVTALVLLLPGGAPGAPSIGQAAALAQRGPVMAAPPRQPGAKLSQDVQEIYFPDWAHLGWRAVGQRIDRLGSRRAVTVYYAWGKKQIAYTILTAPALAWAGTPTRVMHGLVLQTLTAGTRLIITWRRSDHTCVLSGSHVSSSQLAELAAWH